MKFSSYTRQKLLDVNRKKILIVYDNFFMFSIQSNWLEIRLFCYTLSSNYLNDLTY